MLTQLNQRKNGRERELSNVCLSFQSTNQISFSVNRLSDFAQQLSCEVDITICQLFTFFPNKCPGNDLRIIQLLYNVIKLLGYKAYIICNNSA